MKYDDERSNKILSLFLIFVFLAFIFGCIIGLIISDLVVK
jgi:uncharacterized protein YneF (UPF0154 family)